MPLVALLKTGKNLIHAVFPLMARARYGLIGTKLAVIGITGTDGKSSSVILSAAMLREAGNKVAHFSSVSYHDGDTETRNGTKMTTPGRMKLHAFLTAAYRNGCTHAVVEITSQGIAQHRHRHIGFSLVGITNITPEHIEAHQGFERYRATKVSLTHELLHKGNRGLVIEQGTYGEVKHLLPEGIAVRIVPLGGEEIVSHSPLEGPFVAQNILFAAAIAATFDAPLEAVRRAVEKIDCIPGRFEIVARNPLVIVDYAHTLNALGELLPYVRARTKGKLIHVFGAAGGGRDRYKRPLIAKISERYTDASVLTEENPFDEPTERIIEDIRKGFSGAHTVHAIPKREEAVAFARTLLTSADDTLLLTAKGSETVIAGPHRQMRPYTEREYVRCLFETSSSV